MCPEIVPHGSPTTESHTFGSCVLSTAPLRSNLSLWILLWHDYKFVRSADIERGGLTYSSKGVTAMSANGESQTKKACQKLNASFWRGAGVIKRCGHSHKMCGGLNCEDNPFRFRACSLPNFITLRFKATARCNFMEKIMRQKCSRSVYRRY